jgi:hypothetical protein
MVDDDTDTIDGGLRYQIEISRKRIDGDQRSVPLKHVPAEPTGNNDR